ncbi:MAG: succinyl-diaminopimelate desuccinylase [Neisseriaceae bacterium]|nr:MAG: succinyl-diaminopimelate desuccinylase [Neisseriaceae bacterium]
MSLTNVTQTDTIQLLVELLKIPSVTPDDLGCQDVLLTRLEKIGFKCEKMHFNQTSNFWARIGEKKPLVCFAGHTDVVPAGILQNWNSPPFEPTVRNGYLYARGAADMKSGLAAFVTAIERFIYQYTNFNGSIALLVTSDEEGNGVDGTVKVVEKLRDRQELIDYCIVAEPTSINILGDTIKNGRRGSMSAKLRVKGKQGHIAYPSLAINPIHEIAPVLNTLIDFEWDRGIEYFPRTSLQFSNIQAGVGVGNVIPGELTTWFNFRFSPENTVEELQKKVQAILDDYALEYDIEWEVSGKPFITPEGRLTEVVQKVIWDELQVKSDINTLGGTSDGRFIKDIARELIEFGPVNATIHQVNECVKLQDVISLSQIYEKILRELLLS